MDYEVNNLLYINSDSLYQVLYLMSTAHNCFYSLMYTLYGHVCTLVRCENSFRCTISVLNIDNELNLISRTKQTPDRSVNASWKTLHSVG